MNGKGFYIWIINECFGGDIPAIVAELVRGKFKHILVKIANGTFGYNVVDGRDLAAELTQAAKAAGIEVIGWQYVYDTYPNEAADKAIQRIAQTGVTHFVIDAEAELKGKPAVARAYVERLYSQFRLVNTGQIWLSTYRYPSLHQTFPFNEFMAICHGMMPQVYWVDAHNPAEQLKRSYDEWKAMYPDKLYIPTGACYPDSGWKPTFADEVEFLDKAKDMGFPAVNFWDLQHALEDRMAEPYSAIVGYDWSSEVIQPPPEPPLPPVEKIMINTGQLYIRSEPSSAAGDKTVIGWTEQGKVWLVEGSSKDLNDRLWYQVGKGAFIAGWLCKPIN